MFAKSTYLFKIKIMNMVCALTNLLIKMVTYVVCEAKLNDGNIVKFNAIKEIKK